MREGRRLFFQRRLGPSGLKIDRKEKEGGDNWRWWRRAGGLSKIKDKEERLALPFIVTS